LQVYWQNACAVQPVQHFYEYFNFLPVVPDSVSFEPCKLVPGGTGCDCLNLGCSTSAAAAGAALTGTSTNTTAAICDQGQTRGISSKAQRARVALSSARHALNNILHHAVSVCINSSFPCTYVCTA
jgi:hypothetical protein